jgi:competence protein ComEA
MRHLVWVTKEKRIRSQQMGLSILILILLLGWAANYRSSLQGDLGLVEGGNGVFIMITGEVKDPGVYVFEGQPSLKELISRAGRLIREQQSRQWPKLHLTQGTSVQISSENGYIKASTGSIPAAYKVTLKIPISINTASQEGLEAIPGVGPSLAEKIINYRSLYGPFKTAAEIRGVTGMGKQRYLKIRPYIGT